jgi:hypothetical protein
MSEKNFLIVNAAGRQLDLLRSEATRIAKESKGGWWIEQVDAGRRFFFEDAKAKHEFAQVCDTFGVLHRSG